MTITKTCPLCGGLGLWRAGDCYDTCPRCKGKKTITIDGRLIDKRGDNDDDDHSTVANAARR